MATEQGEVPLRVRVAVTDGVRRREKRTYKDGVASQLGSRVYTIPGVSRFDCVALISSAVSSGLSLIEPT